MADRARLLRTGGFNQLAETAEGYLLYNVHDEYTGRAIATYGECSAQELSVLTALCGPGDTVIDVGANTGVHTVALARRVGPSGRVVALEPQRLMFQLLCANVALNSLANVDCHWAAAGPREGKITVPDMDPARSCNFGGISLVGATGGTEVPLLVLDRFLAVASLRLVKMDVEGMEAEVLRGATGLIRRFRPLLYVENDRPDRSEALMRLIDGLGYTMHWDTPMLYNADNFYGERTDVFPTIASFNMLCVPHEQSGLVDAPAITEFTSHPFHRGRSA